MVIELPLHDATFDGLTVKGKSCAMYFTSSDGTRCEVHLSGVDAMQMNDFREGNIVSFFGTTTSEQPKNLAVLDRLYSPPHPGAALEFHERHTSFRNGKISAIVAGKLTLIEMDPAVGADMVAACEQVRLVTVGVGS